VAVLHSDFASEISFDGFLGLAKMGFHRMSFDFEHELFGWV